MADWPTWKNIKNPELQDLADISAQFLRTRESPHGAMQRVVLERGHLGMVLVLRLLSLI